MKYTYDFDPASHLTVGTVGKPGQRTFYIQARKGRQLLSFVVEKEQVRALGQAFERLHDDIVANNPLVSTSDDALHIRDMSLSEPLEPSFRVVQMGLGYDADRDMCVLILHGMSEDDDDQTPSARISIPRGHVTELSQHITTVVNGGRAVCGNCGRPKDPDGHFCPQMN
ncbi:MAG: hypothetical protein RLZZ297_628 [Chloroflexota bacterium]|jgi:uncharacterized repeat protein (TIGR03847 family)